MLKIIPSVWPTSGKTQTCCALKTPTKRSFASVVLERSSRLMERMYVDMVLFLLLLFVVLGLLS